MRLKLRSVHARRRQRGDTIVEVLISLTIVSVVLGGAYVTTNKSLLATRGAQERGNALKLAESQVEQLKGVIATDPDDVFNPGAPSPFCIDSSGVVATSDPDCTVNTGGTATTAEPKFNLSITRSGNTFTIRNSWTNVAGKVTDQLQIKYRLYQ
jgi:type II secretory pathway pseudopilin PulG